MANILDDNGDDNNKDGYDSHHDEVEQYNIPINIQQQLTTIQFFS
jgi:hypothetical protein